ncbi:MAG: glycoside hydrolase family 65 protein, partial [Deltaproteobacteria bacterium]|nr:glycoside hydrolase family 65 protein [Deltaproteobacteria bacterium]
MTHPWTLVYEGFKSEQEGLREALCTLGNGYFATRGAAPQSRADAVHYPGTYLAGGYNRRQTEVSGRTVENEDLVNLPNWLCLTFRFEEGDWFSLENANILSYRQELDLYQGILSRTVVFKDGRGRKTRLVERRLVHMAENHLAGLELSLSTENWSGTVEFRTALDGRVKNAGVERYQGLNNDHLIPLPAEPVDEDTLFLKMETNQSGLRVAQAARTRAYQRGHLLRPERRLVQEEGYIAQEFTVSLAARDEVRIEKVLSLYTSRDHASSECGLEAKKAVARAEPFEGLLRSHARAWSHLWRDFDMVFEHRDPGKSDLTAMILRLNIFHLLQTASTHTMDLDVGIPSRGWHGEAYRGHIFWDELFIFPFLNLRLSEITRSLLLYRYRRLNEARPVPRQEGLRGAMFPWQSGSNGREQSQRLHLNPKSGRWIP